MDDDVKIKLIFAVVMVILYGVVFITQRLDTATVTAILTAFTNTVVGVFTYNLTKRKYKGGEDGKEAME